MNQDLVSLLHTINQDAQTLVWWKPEQIARGENIANNPTKGERPWIIPETTGRFLYDLVIANNFTSVLELGTSIGYSTLWIASALNITGGHITTLERSQNKITVAQNYFAKSGLGESITLLEGEIINSLSVLPTNASFDFVFMDADRGHYHEYFPIIKQHLTSNAIIVADNAGNMNARMKPFFDLLDQESISYHVENIDNGLLIINI